MTVTAVQAAHRFGLGAGPGELDAAARDPAGWLGQQLVAPTPPADGRLLRDAVRAFRRAADQPKGAPRQEALKALFQQTRRDLVGRFDADLVAGALSPRPFVERLVWFWTNHFTVSANGKPRVAPFVRSFQDDAIRPHVLGRFEEMLLAVEQHPAMLVYLDNAISVGPDSPAGQRAGRGLNENLGREILELHTLGVNGGYRQDDVIALSRLITGWTTPVGPFAPDTDDPFVFLPRRHEPGDKILLGERYGEGLAEGERALRDLARRPETARFLATKLCRHFFADAPPAAAVDHVAARYAQSAGDLRRTSWALVEAAAAIDAGPKIRSPVDHMAAAVRALGGSPLPAGRLAAALAGFGQAPFMAGSPAGYPDTADVWAAPDALMRRLEWSAAFAGHAPAALDPSVLAAQTFGGALSRRTADSVAGAESGPQGLTLLLMSPEFMWR